jgi:apolipoprotein N-acyltransferase
VGKPTNMYKNWAIALAGGILMGLTVAPFEFWGFAWIALMPLWWLTQRLSIKQAAIAGGIWGLAYHGRALFWITGIHPMTWLGVPWLASLAIAVGVWLFITLWGLVSVSIWAGLMAWLTPKLPIFARVIVACGLYCGLEMIWSWGALYWTALGYTQSPHNLIVLQISKLSGQQTVTAAIVAINGLLLEGWKDRRYWLGAGILALSICGYGGLVMQADSNPGNQALKAGIIQGNIPNPIKLKANGLDLAIARYSEAYEKLAEAKVDLILTPETAIPLLFPDPLPQREKLDRVMAENPIPTWLGGFGRSRTDYLNYTNSLFLVNGNTEISAKYDKVRLVPIGEFIPFKSILGGVIKRLSPLRGEVEPGSDRQLVDSPWGRVIMGICYESAYPEHFRYQANQGGQIIFTASNNAHYAAPMPAQHHAQDVARAIESDRWAVRATNTGYSGIVDPNGRTIWISGLNTYEFHSETIYLRTNKTLYVLWGDWLTPLLLAIAILLIGWQLYQGSRSSR